ncbi:MAG: NUDIX domain-containing protein [Candidatus Woesearchaeota archaeon]|jgi:ADP-ribose pyrophosphatase YjhB (NUDIX family)
MIYTLQISQELPGVDFKEVTVISDDKLSGILRRSAVDADFRSVYIEKLTQGSLAEENQFLEELVGRYGVNLISCDPRGYTLFRVKEQKRPGRDFPGVGVGVIVLNEKGELAMLRRKNTNNRAGKWEVPGGTVELGQGTYECGEIETWQETTMKVKVKGCVGVYEDMVEGQHWYSFGLVAEHLEGTLQIGEVTKFDACGYFSLDHLPVNTSLLTLKLLDDYTRAGDKYLPLDRISE